MKGRSGLNGDTGGKGRVDASSLFPEQTASRGGGGFRGGRRDAAQEREVPLNAKRREKRAFELLCFWGGFDMVGTGNTGKGMFAHTKRSNPGTEKKRICQ